MNKKLSIRFARNNDLSAIVNIYNQAIRSRQATGDLDEYRVEDRVEWLNKFDKNNYPIYVALIDNNIVGYCYLSPYRQGRRAMSSIAEISYFVDNSFHRKGIGTALMQHAISDCKRLGKRTLLAFILDINISTIGLLEKFNFEKWGDFPDVIDMDGKICGTLIYGVKI